MTWWGGKREEDRETRKRTYILLNMYSPCFYLPLSSSPPTYECINEYRKKRYMIIIPAMPPASRLCQKGTGLFCCVAILFFFFFFFSSSSSLLVSSSSSSPPLAQRNGVTTQKNERGRGGREGEEERNRERGREGERERGGEKERRERGGGREEEGERGGGGRRVCLYNKLLMFTL